MSTIPTVEPAKVVAGDLVQWKRSLGDYPASTWVLTYRLRNLNNNVTITAVADGTDHLVSVPAATSATWVTGKYDYQAFVTSGSDRHMVGTGRIEVLPNYGAITSHDGRTHARKVLEAIEAVIEGRASKDQEEYTIGTRHLKRTPIADLLTLRDSYKRFVADEEAAEKAAAGLGNSRNIGVRLNRI